MSFDASFWVLVATLLFVIPIARPVARIVASGLDKRSARIREELDEAIRMKEEAQSLLASYQRRQKEILADSEKILAHAKEEADRIIASAEAKLEEEVSLRTEVAEQRIAQAEAAVIHEIQQNAVDITISAARTLITDNLDKEVAEEIMQSAISDIDRKFH